MTFYFNCHQCYKLFNICTFKFVYVYFYSIHSRDVTKFEFVLDDVRILATSGVFDIRRIVWNFSVECEQSKYLPFITQNGNGVHVRSWFSAACHISICYNLQIRRLDQWFSALQVLISNSSDDDFNMPENSYWYLVFAICIRYSTNSEVIIRIQQMRIFFTFGTSLIHRRLLFCYATI